MPRQIKDQKVGSCPIPGNLPQIVGIILLLISLLNYPAHKNYHVIFQELSPSEMPHTVCGGCCSLNEPTSLLFLIVLGLRYWVQAFLWLRPVGATLHCSVWASHRGGFSCGEAQALGSRASVVATQGLSSCGTWAVAPRHVESSWTWK